MAISNEEYSGIQQRLLLFARLVRTEDLDGFLERIGRTQSLAPILDPTLYRNGMDNLEHIERLARGLRAFQRVVEEVAFEAADRG